MFRTEPVSNKFNLVLTRCKLEVVSGGGQSWEPRLEHLSLCRNDAKVELPLVLSLNEAKQTATAFVISVYDDAAEVAWLEVSADQHVTFANANATTKLKIRNFSVTSEADVFTLDVSDGSLTVNR